MNVFLPEHLKEKQPWFAESALQYISMSCFLYKSVAGKTCSSHPQEHQAGSGRSPQAPSSERGERLTKPWKHKGSSVGKPGLHSELWKARAGFGAVLSFARQLQQLPQLSPGDDFLITTKTSQPCCIHAARSLIFGTDLSRPVNTKPGIRVFEEQRYNSSSCFLTSSRHCCEKAEELLK